MDLVSLACEDDFNFANTMGSKVMGGYDKQRRVLSFFFFFFCLFVCFCFICLLVCLLACSAS